ncbi:MAG: transcriptional regulator [Sulfurimonas sp. RIFCSPHIGHO2_12_FULL_36_9]|uniref:helix-turn-helix domain-containing protein n=1 Tax=Sulfurimonas sp. RIFCSPLOWO2_12_36_12 TaxID=1802253 RepID=UPI0008BC0E2A|nr:helix-turn-helix transcriptional regulator [Sulfurimonas sp. RIFCSPLOWO2_12_36_12]OHD98907.1 MAG: transcriptional regulator [Sulfurimonas sp. RIFCSPHIGHO2_12_FULL_36_9]OHE00716.1 MAG: transcriptional regulator [Sulfurimonas sp. RIFCSPLOWO2_02_FULL_36_28]OHE02045.1 MAG: transcriptional regulator [Sulfurimonas sp. RIFCSPLOWO2_12_36_12]
MLSINLLTPHSIMEVLKSRFRQKRLNFDLTQEGLANKSGVSLGSIKRFESSGQISLDSLLKIAFVLECLDDFTNIANEKETSFSSIDELLKEKILKKRGTIK